LIDKKTVFVLGAGASCPYGYPSGALLHKRVCLSQGLWQHYNDHNPPDLSAAIKKRQLQHIREFIDAFNKAQIKSIDLFIANNSELAPIGKYIIAFEIFRAERQSLFGEEAKFEQEQIAYLQNHGRCSPLDLFTRPLFLGEDWYFYFYNRLIEGLVSKNALPDFSDSNLSFITFNYDRSLDQFLYEGLCNFYKEVPEPDIIECLKKLKILHIYGQIAPLKWQNQDNHVDYKPQLRESLLERAANNIRTIYEEKQNPELTEAQNLLKQAEQIFFLGFGYAPENMEILGLPESIPQNCKVYGTAFGLIEEEIRRIYTIVHGGRKYEKATKIESGNVDSLMLLRKYLN